VNLKKNLHIKSFKFDFNQTCQDCSLGKGLAKLFKQFDPVQKSDCHGIIEKIVKKNSLEPAGLGHRYFAQGIE
jgi:hypothetical protein